jgi:putative transposase
MNEIVVHTQERKGRKKKVNEREIKVEEIQGKTIWEAKT